MASTPRSTIDEKDMLNSVQPKWKTFKEILFNIWLDKKMFKSLITWDALAFLHKKIKTLKLDDFGHE